jgi:hypothetical protein
MHYLHNIIMKWQNVMTNTTPSNNISPQKIIVVFHLSPQKIVVAFHISPHRIVVVFPISQQKIVVAFHLLTFH